jgi:autotransporter translocation and assembly factor TamB
MIIPELEAVSGKKITVQKIYFNIIPFYVEARNMEISSDDGDEILTVNKVKGYIDLMNLLERNISIQRLIFKNPHIVSDREQIEEIVSNIKTYSKKEDDEDDTEIKVKVEVGIIECDDGVVSFTDRETDSIININGLDGEVALEEEPEIKMSIKNFDVKKSGWPDLTGDFKASVVLKKDNIEVKSLELGSYGSRLKGKGFYSEGKSSFKTDIALLVDSVKRFFNLRQKGNGKISAEGEVRLGKVRSLNDIFVDLKLKGDFYLETLMELLEVTDPLEGLVDLKGEIKGPLPDISGKAKVRFRKGNLYTVSVDELTCDVLYHDKTFTFENGVASLYNGRAQASSTLTLPGPEAFTLKVAFNEIDSSGAFKLIGWDPGIPEGKVEGELFSSGKEFNPDGWFQYTAKQHTDENVLGRIKDIKGSCSVMNDVISFTSMQIHTAESTLNANGTVDMARDTLNLNVQLDTNEVSDLTLPYYSGVSGNGDFSGTVTGGFDNPKLSGKAHMSDFSLESYAVDNFTATFSYDKKLLAIQKAVFSSPKEEHAVHGDVSFPEAKDLFDLASPVYNLNVSIKNADFSRALNVVSKDTPAKGNLKADVKIDTKDSDFYISGHASLERASVYSIPLDSASLDFSYGKEELEIKNATIKNSNSVLTGEGMLSPDKGFSYAVSSKKFLLKDLGLDRMPDDVVVKLQSQGKGTFQNPTITLTAQFIGGSFEGRAIGSGAIEFTVKDKNIVLDATLFNEKLILQGKGYLDEKLPWSAQLTFHPGRYDFIIASILKEVPEDLQLDLSGKIDMNGDRKNISVSATINHFLLSLFEQTFSNESDIRFSINNKKISVAALTLKSGSTSFRLKGGLEIGKQYDIFLDGSSALAPLKGFSKKIGYMQGHSDFVITVKGDWDDPDIKGGMNLENASFGLRDYPTYISSINGYLTLDKNKITLRDLSGKIGGGTVSISGIVYLQAFRFKRFYGDVKLDNITTFITRNFHVNFDGNLLYRGTLDKQTITGDIQIKRATYKEPIKLSSLLIATKSKEIPRAELATWEKTTLNVKISGSRNISIDNNIVRAPIKVDMLLRGTLASPVLFGRVESKEGYAYFRNNEFRIISASADFADPHRINPFVNLASETIIQGYKINLNFEGMMDSLELSLYSDPHLEEGDILSLLTVGYTGEQAQTAQSGLSTGILAGVAQEVLEDRVRNIIGLDRFYIDTYISKTTSTVVPRVTVSKRIVGDKLIITYSTPFITPEVQEQNIKLEHFVNRDFSLIGTWDEYGGFGGDIKYRLEFK